MNFDEHLLDQENINKVLNEHEQKTKQELGTNKSVYPKCLQTQIKLKNVFGVYLFLIN